MTQPTLQQRLDLLIKDDALELARREESYGGSWKAYGGFSAFMNIARKWQRIEHQAKGHGYDIFKAVEAYSGPDGTMDDIRDLRRYLLLIEDHCYKGGEVDPGQPRGKGYVDQG